MDKTGFKQILRSLINLILISLLIGCDKSVPILTDVNSTNAQLRTDTVDLIQFTYGYNSIDLNPGLIQIDFYLKNTIVRTYFLGDNWGIGVPVYGVIWPANITYAGISPLLYQDSIKSKSNIQIEYAVDTVNLNKVVIWTSYALGSFSGDTISKFMIKNNGRIKVISPVMALKGDSVTTSVYNNCIYALNDWYVRYWYYNR